MTYTIEFHGDLPAIIGTWREDFVFAHDGKPYAQKMHAALEQQTSPVYYVLDLRQWHNMSFEELAEAANIGARGDDPNFHHKMNCGTLVLTNDPMLNATAEGMRSDIFGNVDMVVFPTLEDAEEYIIQNS